MKYGFFAFLFLALAMTVISAPTGKTGAVSNTNNHVSSNAKSTSQNTKSSAKKVQSGGAKKKRGTCKRAQQALIAAKQKPSLTLPGGKHIAGATTAKKGGKKGGLTGRGLNSTAASDLELFRRAGETQLCGLNLRGGSSRMCQGNPAYLFSTQSRTSSWYPWDTIKNRMTSANIPSKYQCDHALELQLTASALTAAGFCTAWEEMRAAWKKYDRHRNVDQIMRQQFFDGGFKATANDFTMLFYVDTRFNEIKRAFTAAYLRGSPQQTTTQLKNYFHAGVVDIVDRVAANIDAAAYSLLDAINALATPQHYDEETATDAEKELVCSLDTAQTVTFRSWDNPVQSYWTGMKEIIHV